MFIILIYEFDYRLYSDAFESIRIVKQLFVLLFIKLKEDFLFTLFRCSQRGDFPTC